MPEQHVIVENWIAGREASGWFDAINQSGYNRRVARNQWREVSAKYGPDSGPARGALLALVRLAWGDSRLFAEYVPSEEGWRIASDFHVRMRVWEHSPRAKLSGVESELAVLVAALEASP